jgi:cyclophilin family peptidyl-prolyl cis-trans isomerase
MYIAEMLSAPQSPLPLRTAALEALLEIRASPDFEQSGDLVARNFDNILRNTILSGDAALVALGAGALRNRRWNYKERLTDYSFLEQAKQQLKLPAETETLIEIEKTLAYLKGLPEPEVPAPAFNHPVNWALVSKTSASQKAEIITSRGKIVLELLVEDAPGSVANFITLAQEGAYNQKVFHRIVPNFVVQGGCPRGDGYGSPDYSIRSEFAPLSYAEGMVGMASAGKDTEGSQWFITHLATPHLDGRYTIFARVTEGMEVVHRLELGDLIETVRINSGE